MNDINLELVFKGKDADHGTVQFYDVAHALVGFERAISLTNHLIINGEIITQSPAAKGFQLFSEPPEEGSWKTIIGVIFGGALTVGVASKDSALGYLSVSLLDYVLQQSLGFEVDFDKTLGKQIKETKELRAFTENLDEHRIHSLIEKIEPSIRQCHRPIAFSNSAESAHINWEIKGTRGTLDAQLNESTWEYIFKTRTRDDLEDFEGIISSYNINTYKGRLYVRELKRTVPFELSDHAKTPRATKAIAGSLYENNSKDQTFRESVRFRGFRRESINSHLKSIFVTRVNPSRRLSDLK